MEKDAPQPRLSAACLLELTVVRDRALDVLEHLRAISGADGATANAIVALQEAANKLGDAEAILSARDADGDAPAPILGPGDPSLPTGPMRWRGEASAVIALAEFTIPYATSRADEAGRWLRVLRREGAVGRGLGDLGFPETELGERAEPVAQPRDLAAVHAVRDKAVLLARHRWAESVTTTDVLFAVLTTYGGLAERALYAHGISRRDLLEQLSLGAGAADTLRR
jgi:hypothetical protein